MSDVTIIGLGLMGTALAETLHTAGVNTTVWNRSPEKMRPFGDRGVATATSAVAASEIVIICIDNYTTTESLLESAEVRPCLEGRTIVQFSSGTPKEARQAGDRMREAGAAYLDGKLLCGPPAIGTESSCIRVSGEASAYDRVTRYLPMLDPGVRYLGDNVAAAATVDLAWLMTCYGNFVSLVHAAKICESESTSLDHLLDVFPERSSISRYLKVIESGAYGEHSASLAVWAEALQHIREQGSDAGIDTRIPDFIASYFDEAVASGYGDEHVMALFKTLN